MIGRIATFLLFISSISLPFSSQASKVDSLQEVLSSTLNDSTFVAIQLSLARFYTTKRLDSAETHIQSAIERAEANCSPLQVAGCYEVQANYLHFVREDPDSAHVWVSKAANLLEETKADPLLVQYYSALGKKYEGIHLRDIGEFNLAQQRLLESIGGFESLEDNVNLLHSYNQLVILYGVQDMLDEAMEVLDKGIAIAQEGNQPYQQMTFLCNKGGVQEYQGNSKQAIETYRKAEGLIFTQLDSSDAYSLGMIYNNIGECFLSKPNLDSSFHYKKKALVYRRKIQNRPSLTTSLGSLCELCIEMGDLRQAKSYCDQMQVQLDSIEAMEIQSRMLKPWIMYYQAKGNFKAAFEKLTEQIELREKLINEKNIAQQTEQRKDFEFEKERLAKAEELKRSELERERATFKFQAESAKSRFLVGAGIALLAVIGLIAFAYFRNQAAKRKIAQKNKALNISIAEKELLLEEIHHRAKNNLQLISSLLRLQSRKVEDEKVLSILEEGQNRVQAMTLIHQKLYRKDKVGMIDFRAYMNELLAQFSGIRNNSQEVDIQVDCPKIDLDIDTAIPLGLILNELITNSFKYAFPNNPSPQLSISLQNSGEGNYALYMTDNGQGLPENFDWQKAKTQGIRLVRSLTKQLQGKLEYEKGMNSSTFIVMFQNQFSRKLQP